MKRSYVRALQGERVRREIREMFSDVQEFSPTHLRLYGLVDVWPTTGKYWIPTLYKKGIFHDTAELMDIIDEAERYSNK